MRKQTVSLLLLCFLTLTTSTPTVVRAQDLTSQQALYNRFKQYQREKPELAYEAAKEYIRRYPEDKSENAQFMRRFVVAYEKVIGGTAVTPPAAQTSESKLPARKHYELGETHERLEEWSAAEDEFRQAVLLEPSFLYFRERLVQVLVRQSKYAEAETEYRELIRAKPDDKEYRLGLAEVLLNQQNFKEASAEYRKYKLLGGTLYDDKEELKFAEALTKDHRWDEAEEILKRLSFNRGWRNPDDERRFKAKVWLIMGEMYTERGDLSAAGDAYRLAVLSAPDRQDARSRLRVVSESLSPSSPSEIPDSDWITYNYGSYEVLSFLRGGVAKYAYTEKIDDRREIKSVTRHWSLESRIVYLSDKSKLLNVFLIVANKLCDKMSECVKADFRTSLISLPSFIKSEPDNIVIGVKLLSNDRFKQAETIFRTALTGKSEQLQGCIFAALAIALAGQKRWSESEEALKETLKRFSKSDYDYGSYKSALDQVRRQQIPQLSSKLLGL